MAWSLTCKHGQCTYDEGNERWRMTQPIPIAKFCTYVFRVH